MSGQISAEFEIFTAHNARMRLFRAMYLAMAREIRTSFEAFLTHFAFVGFFFAVNATVTFYIGGSAE
jgi:hypothetical protein